MQQPEAVHIEGADLETGCHRRLHLQPTHERVVLTQLEEIGASDLPSRERSRDGAVSHLDFGQIFLFDRIGSESFMYPSVPLVFPSALSSVDAEFLLSFDVL